MMKTTKGEFRSWHAIEVDRRRSTTVCPSPLRVLVLISTEITIGKCPLTIL